MKPAHPARLFTALLLLLVLSGLDQTLLGTMLPTITAALGHGELAPWVFSTYLTAATVAVPVYGKLADRYGPWPVLLWAAGLFTLGSAACAAAVSMPMLVAARALQGLGGGGLMTLALLTATWLYPAAERGRRMGLIGAAYSLSTLVGPLAGGALLRVLPWQSAFLLNLPCAALAWVLIRRARFGRGSAKPARFDMVGATLLCGAMAALLWCTRHPVASSTGAAAAALTLLLITAWLVSARYTADPVVPLALLGDTGFRTAAGLAAMSGVVLFGAVVFVPLYLQTGLHRDPLESAACIVPLMLGISLSAQYVGRALRAGRSLPALATLAGLLMTTGAAAVAMLLRLAPTASWGIGAALLPVGLGLGLCFPVTTIIAQRRAPAAQLGAASALPVMLRTLGGALAVASLGELLRRHMAEAAASGLASAAQATLAMAEGMSTVFCWLAVAAGLVLLWAIRLQGRSASLLPVDAAPGGVLREV